MPLTPLNSKLIYPNPFKPVGIEFDLAEEAVVTIEIIDGSGKPVSSILSEQSLAAGHHIVESAFRHSLGKTQAYRLTARYRGAVDTETKTIRAMEGR